MVEDKEKKDTKSKIKVVVTFIILYLIDQLFRIGIIDRKWFLLAFILLVAYLFIGGIVIKLMHKEKTNNIETNNEIAS